MTGSARIERRREEQQRLKQFDRLLDELFGDHVSTLDRRKIVTYRLLREAVLSGDVDDDDLRRWGSREGLSCTVPAQLQDARAFGEGT